MTASLTIALFTLQYCTVAAPALHREPHVCRIFDRYWYSTNPDGDAKLGSDDWDNLMNLLEHELLDGRMNGVYHNERFTFSKKYSKKTFILAFNRMKDDLDFSDDEGTSTSCLSIMP